MESENVDICHMQLMAWRSIEISSIGFLFSGSNASLYSTENFKTNQTCLQQLLDGCVQRQQASSHDTSFAAHTNDSLTEETMPAQYIASTSDQAYNAEMSLPYCPSPADGFSAGAYSQSSFVSVLQDTVFLLPCAHSEEDHAAAAAAREADPFHDDWPYWDQAGTRSETRHGA